MSLFSIDCRIANEELMSRVLNLRNILANFELDENREVNRG